MATARNRKTPVWFLPVGIVVGLGLALLFFFAIIQLIPYGREHTNPANSAEPAWDSPETRALVKRACFDCHSNETVWPWYSNVAPISWLIARDVQEGRYKLNFSEWGLLDLESTAPAEGTEHESAEAEVPAAEDEHESAEATPLTEGEEHSTEENAAAEGEEPSDGEESGEDLHGAASEETGDAEGSSESERPDIDEMIEEIESGAMPPAAYLSLHPDAKLSEEEKAALIAGLRKSLLP